MLTRTKEQHIYISSNLAEKGFPERQSADKAIRRNFRDIHDATFKSFLFLSPFYRKGEFQKVEMELDILRTASLV